MKLTDKKGQPIDNEIAHRALAWVHMDKKEFPQSAEELGNAAALDPRDIWIRYYLALLKYKTAQTNHEEIQGLANMMIDLKVTLDWYPEFAEAYNMLAMARIEGGGVNSALEAIGRRSGSVRETSSTSSTWGRSTKPERNGTWRGRFSNGCERARTRRLRPRPATTGATGDRAEVWDFAGCAQNMSAQTSPFDELEQEAQKRAQAPPEETTPDKRPTQFLKGTLLSVDCSRAPAAVLVVSNGREVAAAADSRTTSRYS